MSRRRPGLQSKWAYVVNSLQEIIPSYEKASSRISLHSDRLMRAEVVSFGVKGGSLVLDLGSGPGTLSKLVARAGGTPVLLDVSAAMLKAAPFQDRVQAAFEHLPFRDGVFASAVSGFAVRDSLDLGVALAEVRRVVAGDGRFAFCDLGKPDSLHGFIAVAAYLRVFPSVIGLVTSGRVGLRYGSLFDTFILVLRNSELRTALASHFRNVKIHERQLGGSIVVMCSS